MPEESKTEEPSFADELIEEIKATGTAINPAEMEYAGVCMDCGTPNRDNHVIKQLESGFDNASCTFCGGVVEVVPLMLARQAVARSRRSRGLPE